MPNPLLPGFCNCARHCWCAYREDDAEIMRLDAALIVRAFKEVPHTHSPDPQFPNGCVGCAIEEGRVRW